MDAITPKLIATLIPEAVLIKELRNLLTPKSILEQSEFKKPYVISPKDFQTHQSLLEYRTEIRDLKLVPVKDDITHEAYNNTDKVALLSTILPFLEESEMVLAPNLYPYWLPTDTDQRLLWVRDRDISEEKILEFIARSVIFLNLSLDNLIIFERPLTTQAKLVKGSFSHLRHIHFWFDKNKHEKN